MNYRPLHSDDKVLILPGAQVIGDVQAGEETSFWYNCVCRGEEYPVRFGRRCNIQDNVVIHGDGATICGDDVSIGHGAIVHGATVGDRVLIGMGAMVLNGARIGSDCVVGAGALVTGKTVVPDGSMVLGSPAKLIRPLTDAERELIAFSRDEYLKKSAEYRAYLAESEEEQA